MSAVAATTRAPAKPRAAPHPTRPAPAQTSVKVPRATCACGGGCPRCATASALRHSRPGDASEAAAHAAADHALRRSPVGSPAGQVPATSTVVADAAEPAVAAGLRSSARPLDAPARRAMEARFGRDLGNIRVHDGTGAAASAAALRARAYTVGRDIVFGDGEYRPDSPSGRHVLAHEVAHTLQPDSAASVRRLDMDFRIEGIAPAAAWTSDTIFFERGMSFVSLAERPKIALLATPPLQNLTLHGYSSEDASAADRVVRVNARLAAVDAALQAAGHRGARVLVPHPDDGVGDSDYRGRRAVTVSPTPVGALSALPIIQPSNSAGAVNPVAAALAACEASFTAAFPTALAIANAAEAAIVTAPTAAANALVAQFFGGVSRAAVDANVSAIAAQVRQLPARHQCHTSADGGCDRPAYNDGRGLGATGALMTLCPTFVSADLPFRIKTLIHEAAHGNPVESIEDVAYANTRLLPALLPGDRRRNTDSYVLLMSNVHTAGSLASGPATPDIYAGMTGTGAGSDTEMGMRALGWLESWLNYGDFDTGLLYRNIADAVRDGAWPTVRGTGFNIETMNRLATAFPGEISDPGPDGTPRTTLPTEQDKIRVAAIHERFDSLYASINQRQLTVTRLAPGMSEAWARHPGAAAAPAGPQLDPVVGVAPSFFALSEAARVLRLMALMVHAHTGISQPFEALYVRAIDLIRQHRRMGP